MDEPIPAGATEPVDVVQVRADEALIAALGRADTPVGDPADPIDERLAGLLRSWRDDVHSVPERPLVDLTTAQAALATAPRPRRRHNPVGPWATAAAVLVIAFVGMGLAAKGAEPGDPLWNVTKVLYSEKAKSVEAAVTVRNKLDQATAALHSGKISEAQDALEEARRNLSAIAIEDGQQDLADRTEQLQAELVGNTGPKPPATSQVGAPATSTSALVSTTSQAPAPPPVTSEPPPPATTDSPTPTTEPGTGVGTSSPEPPSVPGGGGSSGSTEERGEDTSSTTGSGSGITG
ncbi:MAG TPA: anti-sigma-D factor RsdA [Pseudonocardiaceae bacterium]